MLAWPGGLCYRAMDVLAQAAAAQFPAGTVPASGSLLTAALRGLNAASLPAYLACESLLVRQAACKWLQRQRNTEVTHATIAAALTADDAALRVPAVNVGDYILDRTRCLLEADEERQVECETLVQARWRAAGRGHAGAALPHKVPLTDAEYPGAKFAVLDPVRLATAPSVAADEALSPGTDASTPWPRRPSRRARVRHDGTLRAFVAHPGAVGQGVRKTRWLS